MERYNIIEKLGEGTFGCVWKAINMENGEMVAIKTMKRKYYSWEECLNLQEVKSLRKMNHAHIVKLNDVIKEHDTVYFVFEYMDGNLYQLIKSKRKSFSEDEIRTLCLQVIQGLAYMHQQGYFHRDLKPENLLVKENIIKIGDLGSAREINSPPPYTEYVTTRWYRAPEVMLQSGVYNSAVDMWAMGAIMAEMFTSSPIFPGSSVPDQMYKIYSVIGTPTENKWHGGLKHARVINYRFPQCPGVSFSDLMPSASDDAINLITMLCSWDPSKRPTALEALRHPFFKGCYQVPPSVNKMSPSVVTMTAMEKKSLPRHYGTLPNLKPGGIFYPANPQISGVPYMVFLNNQGINMNYNLLKASANNNQHIALQQGLYPGTNMNSTFSKAVARPKPRFINPSVYDNDMTRGVTEMLANTSITNQCHI